MIKLQIVECIKALETDLEVGKEYIAYPTKAGVDRLFVEKNKEVQLKTNQFKFNETICFCVYLKEKEKTYLSNHKAYQEYKDNYFNEKV